MTLLAMGNDINKIGVRCLGMCTEEMSPCSAVMGSKGVLKLKISGWFHIRGLGSDPSTLDPKVQFI